LIAGTLDQQPVKVLLLGPCPPPDHGTSVPFGHLVRFLQDHYRVRLSIVNSHVSGSPLRKAGALGAVWSAIAVVLRTISQALRCPVCLLYGSQAFIATIGSVLTLLLRSVMRKKVVVYVPGGEFDVYFSRLPAPLRRLVRWTLSRADALVLQTRLSAENLAGSFSNLRVVSNWMDTLQSGPGTTEDPTVRFVFMGEIRREKGVGELLAAFPRARQQMWREGWEITLDLYGAPREETAEALDRIAAGWYPGVRYHPPVPHDRYVRELAQYDVLILPTYMPSEGHPGVLIEAQALGIPVIATRWRSLPEVVEDGVNGILCDPRDTESLRIAIETLASDPDLRRRLGRSGQTTAGAFRVERVLPELAGLCGLAPLATE